MDIALLDCFKHIVPEFEEDIDVCFGFNSVLKKILGAPENHRATSFGSTATADNVTDEMLHKKILHSIRDEISKRGFPSTELLQPNLTLISDKEKIEIPDGKGGTLVLRPQPVRMDLNIPASASPQNSNGVCT